MIAFDNGPANGDYVRYIDGLMERAALAAAKPAARNDDMANGLVERPRERAGTAGPFRAAGGAEPGERNSVAPSAAAVRGSRAAATRDSGFATPVAASPAVASASALASALMSGQVGRGMALGTTISLWAVVVGALLVAAGLLWQPLNLAVAIGGIALIGWAIGRMRARGIESAPGTTST